MTITATADVAFSPPVVQVNVSVPAGNLMTSVGVWRNDSSGRSLLRSQPSPGFASRTVADYECPYGQNVTYEWESAYYNPADNATTFSEPWSTFPGSWTGETGDATIASNRVTVDGGVNNSSSIVRSGLSADWDSITVEYLDSGGSDRDPTLFLSTSLGTVRISEWNGFLVNGRPVFPIGGTDPINLTTVPAHQSFTIVRTPSGFTVRGSVAGEYTNSTALSGTLTQISIQSGVGDPAEVAVVGAITAETFATTTDVAEESSAVMLSPDSAWLIAPQAPALSVPLSNTDQQAAGIRQLSSVGNASNTKIHRILGTTTPVTTTTGNRQADTLSATVYTHTSDERVALRALLAPDLPILINVPPAWELELAYGFYQVGDVTETRPYTLGGIPMRDFELPLSRVRSPEVDVENPGWSYSQVASTWATYSELLSRYATYGDLAVDNRS